jgi:aryl-alcohol dehydrogenase-like predicted oxidoreductase
MEYRLLGGSGLKVPALSFGTGTFGGGNEFSKAWGSTDVAEATRLIDICLEAGVNLFDTANIYSDGRSEEVLGNALAGKRDRALISTKATFRLGEGPNDVRLLPLPPDALSRSQPAPPRHRLRRHLPPAWL